VLSVASTNKRHTVVVRHLRDGGNVQHIQARVAHRLAKQQLGVGADGGSPSVNVTGFDKGGLDAKTAQRVVQQVVRAAIQSGARHNVRARAHERGHTQVQRGLAAGGGNGADAALQSGDALLEHRGGGVADAAVDVASAFQIEKSCRLVGRLKDIRRG
jgi:hypothetical protein